MAVTFNHGKIWVGEIIFLYTSKPIFLDTDLKDNIAFKDKIDDFKIR